MLGSVPPIVIGAPATLFATIIAVAPADWAVAASCTKLHAPRSTSATAPAGSEPAGYILGRSGAPQCAGHPGQLEAQVGRGGRVVQRHLDDVEGQAPLDGLL